jgi:hypothetical protein
MDRIEYLTNNLFSFKRTYFVKPYHLVQELQVEDKKKLKLKELKKEIRSSISADNLKRKLRILSIPLAKILSISLTLEI